MARWYEPTKEQEEAWSEWVAERPPNVRAVAERFKPWVLYFLPSSPGADGKPLPGGGETGNNGHRVTLVAFDEGDDDKVYVRVSITGQFNRLNFNRDVFGIDPSRLTECDLPPPGEKLGVLMTDVEALASMDTLKAVFGLPDECGCGDPKCALHSWRKARAN